jgi:hypothetical protein
VDSLAMLFLDEIGIEQQILSVALLIHVMDDLVSGPD